MIVTKEILQTAISEVMNAVKEDSLRVECHGVKHVILSEASATALLYAGSAIETIVDLLPAAALKKLQLDE